MIDRKREVSVEKMDAGQIENLSQQIGEKVSKLLNQTADEANKFLSIYGLTIKVGYKIVPLTTTESPKKE